MKVKINGNSWYEVTAKYHSIDPVHPTPHTGIDFAMPIGTELNSPINGVIAKIADYGDVNAGKTLFIKGADGKTVVMGHLSEFKCKVGQRVHEGDLVALSGNTGHSTGAHLHLGLKDSHGNIISPNEILDDNHSGFKDYALEKSGLGFLKGREKNPNVNADDFKDRNIYEIMYDIKEHGFWEAIYGESFFEILKGFVKNFVTEAGTFIVTNGDLFFLIPAVLNMGATFVLGSNKYTKYTIPLWFLYFLSRVFYDFFVYGF